MAERTAWRDRYADEVPCIRCLEPRDLMELDRLLWCDACRRNVRNRAGWWGWAIGLAFGAGVAAYVWLVIRPTDLVIGGWVATVVAGIWISSKVGRELSSGVMRYPHSRSTPDDAAGPPSEAAPH